MGTLLKSQKMKNFTLASWNINSIRIRTKLVQKFVKAHKPDILCLQEIKCTQEQFPADVFHEMGFRHQLIKGQKAYHGVAILSRVKLACAHDHKKELSFGGLPHARHLWCQFETSSGPIDLYNFYVPAGGDVPDPKENDKFAHKLRFVDDMTRFFKKQKTQNAVLVGDLNIAPGEQDVWSHKQLLNVVSHTPVETEKLKKLIRAGSWIDIARKFVPEDQKLYSWWSYRAGDNWRQSDRGRRLDHIWTSPNLNSCVQNFMIEKKARSWNQPSDHVPVIIKIKL